MKKQNRFNKIIVPLVASFIVIAAAGCSTFGGGSKSSQDISASGPTILNARTSPGTFDLNGQFQSAQSAAVLADVKDFTGKINSVTLRFVHAPLEIPMEQISDTTWRAVLNPQQLRLLAVSGQTIKYDANIVARDENGQVAVNEKPLVIAVKAPDVSKDVS